MQFADRGEAGARLAERLAEYKNKNAIILALPRGGVVLGAEVAKALRLPLGVSLVSKIGHPASSEYAIGAVADDAEPVFNQAEAAAVSEDWLQEATESARQLNTKRRALYYKEVMPPEMTGKTVILVDDGIATGLTMDAAINVVKQHDPKQIVIAVPVAPADTIAALARSADEVIVLGDPADFKGAVGAHYEAFEQVNDEEVVQLLREVQHDIQQTAAGNP